MAHGINGPSPDSTESCSPPIGIAFIMGSVGVFYLYWSLDHIPIFLDGESARKGPSPFGLKNLWSKDEGFEDLPCK